MDAYKYLHQQFLNMSVENDYFYDEQLIEKIKKIYNNQDIFEDPNIPNKANELIHIIENIAIPEIDAEAIQHSLEIDSFITLNKKLLEKQQKYNGAQIKISNLTIDSIAKRDEIFSFADQLAATFEHENIRPGKKPNYAGSLNAYCAIANLEVIHDYTNTDFFDIPQHINPLTNPFFDNVLNHWYMTSTQPLQLESTEIDTWFHQLGQEFWLKRENLKDRFIVINNLLKNRPEKAPIQFVFNLLHYKKSIDLIKNLIPELTDLMRIEATINPILDLIVEKNYKNFSKNISLSLQTLSTPIEKLQTLEHTFDYLLQNNNLQIYKKEEGTWQTRNDKYQVNTLLQNHLKDLKNAYMDILKKNPDDKQLLNIAKQSRLINFNRTRFQLFWKKKTATYEQIEKLERKTIEEKTKKKPQK